MDELKKRLLCNPHIMCADNVVIEMKRDREILQVISTGDPNVYTIVRGDNRSQRPKETATFMTMCSYVVDYHLNFFKMQTNTVFPKGINQALEICQEMFKNEVDPTGSLSKKIKEEYEKEISTEVV